MDEDEFFEQGDKHSTEGVRARLAGDAEAFRENFQKAIDAYEHALVLAPPDDVLLEVNLKLCIGARRGELGEADLALDLFGEAQSTLEERADLLESEEGAELHSTARLNRANVLIGLKRKDEARAELEAVRAVHPDNPYLLHLLELIGAGS